MDDLANYIRIDDNLTTMGDGTWMSHGVNNTMIIKGCRSMYSRSVGCASAGDAEPVGVGLVGRLAVGEAQ